MTGALSGPRWLNEQEARAWRAYVISKPLLEYRLHRELVEGHSISLVDYEVLVRLAEARENEMRMSELAEETASSKSRISHQIARMEAEGLVTRRQHAGDGRGVVAALTPTGMDMLRTSAPTHVTGVREHLIDLLSADEREVLARVFERLISHLRGFGT
jgi:DNA-binding MarR family transcriptional regulator